MSLRKLGPSALLIALLLSATATMAALDQASKSSEISLLQNAYVLLSQANHDYDGHRVKAMQSIHKAAVLLRVNLQAKGDVHEDQGTSDSKLEQAHKMLKQARTFAAAKKQRKLVKHLDTAIDHLSTALNIK
jgi:hypothetical protein